MTSKKRNRPRSAENAEGPNLTDSILAKWTEQRTFIRFLNGDTSCCDIRNLAYVHLRDAMANIDEWKVDWDINLTEEEKALVKTSEWRDGLRFG